MHQEICLIVIPKHSLRLTRKLEEVMELDYEYMIVSMFSKQSPDWLIQDVWMFSKQSPDWLIQDVSSPPIASLNMRLSPKCQVLSISN